MRYAKLQKKLGKATLALKDRMRYITLSKKFVLSAEDACKIAFASNHNRMQLALRFQVSKRTVRRTLLLSALTLLEVQMKQLHDFKDYVAEHRPDFGVTTIMWDETSQSLALDAAPGTRQQMSSTWSVLVCRIRFAAGWVRGIKVARELILPPVPLSTNAAHNIYQGLYGHALTKPIMDALDSILSHCRLTCRLNESDAHLANEKLHRFQYFQRMGSQESQAPAEALAAGQAEVQQHGRVQARAPSLPAETMEQIFCQNHQTQLTVTALVDSLNKSEGAGGHLIPNLYCATLFLRMGGHFVRLLASVQQAVKSRDFFHWVPLPSREELAEGREFGDELASYIIDNLRHNARQMASTSRGTEFGWQRTAKEVRHVFRHILNAPYWHRDRLCHYCVNQCCQNREQAERRVVWGILHVVLRSLPGLPLLKDWVKLGPSLDFFICAEHQGILFKLMKNASWASKFPQRDNNCEETTLVDWAKLAGTRYQRSCQMLESVQERLQRTVLAIVHEPLRHPHASFLQEGHTELNDGEWPGLLDQLWAPTSRFQAVLQYLSSMLCGNVSRTRLVWQLSGCASFEDWLQGRPEEARFFRARVLLVAQLVQRRYNRTLNTPALQLFSLSDVRRTDHQETIQTFMSKKPCCYVPGFGREIRQVASAQTLGILLVGSWSPGLLGLTQKFLEPAFPIFHRT